MIALPLQVVLVRGHDVVGRQRLDAWELHAAEGTGLFERKRTPCREGTYWMRHLIDRLRDNRGSEEEVALLLNVAKQMQNKCLCPLGEFSTMAVVTGIERFPQDFARRATVRV